MLPTIVEPLRADWEAVKAAAVELADAGDKVGAIAELRRFHANLCGVTILDPACGTGNFLYVSLELMKRLEGEVLEALLDLGGQEALRGLGSHGVDPHQFLGLDRRPLGHILHRRDRIGRGLRFLSLLFVGIRYSLVFGLGNSGRGVRR